VAEQAHPTVIRNVTLLDGTGAAPVPGQALIVEGRRISWIGPEAQLPEGSDGHAIDGQGGTIMPGMINCHVHLTNDGSPDLFGQVERDSVTVSALRGYLNLQATLQSGVTSVRDCGAANGIALDLATAVDDGLVPGPRIRAAGRVITMTGGHGHFIGREAELARLSTLLEQVRLITVTGPGGVGSRRIAVTFRSSPQMQRCPSLSKSRTH